MKVIGQMLVFLAMVSAASATPAVPEIDGSTATSAIALISGGLLIMRANRKK